MTITALGSRIRQARKDKGLTQEQLAQKLHVTRQTVSNWENERFQPDYETLALIAETLSMKDWSPPQLPGAQARETVEAAEASEAAPPSSRKAGRRYLLPFLAAAALLAGVVLWLCLAGQPARQDGGYTLAWFQQEQQPEAQKAFVRVYTHEPVIQAVRGTPTATPMWRFSIFLKEESGIGLTVERVDYVYFSGLNVYRVDAQTEDCLHEGLTATSPYIGPRQYRQLDIGTAADDATTGLGFALFGTDDNGNALSFRSYIPLENLYR